MRLFSAGIPRAIAQRPLLLGALVLAATLGAAAPAGAAAPDALATLPAQVAQPVSTATDALPPVAVPAQPAPPAPAAAPPAPELARQAAQAVARPVESARGTSGSAADVPNPVGTGPTPLGAGAARAVDTAATELSRRTPLGRIAGDPHPAATLDGLLRSLGDTLRSVVPLDSLAGPLPGGAELGQLTRSVLGDLATPSVRVLGGLLPSYGGAAPPGLGAAQVPRGVAPISFRSASAQPPAGALDGGSASPSPRKAPAPAAGGTVASAPGGISFVPFLALLVLAALAVPPLLRRLDAAPALLRPALFVCALERPG